jgi:hypothetical protein
VPRTSFDPRMHGFAFANTFEFDEAERQHLRKTFARYLLWGGVLGAVVGGLLGVLIVPFFIPGAVVLGLIGAILVPLCVLALRKQLESHLAPHYGLCGGMCFVVLDFYSANRPVPRGQGANDQPAPGTRLHGYIWKRQMASIFSDGARFMAWLISLNYVPPAWPFGGGPARLLARSKREWQTLKTSVDAGQPVPIGLVRDARNIYDNHQVLAIGYDEVDEAQRTVYLYDPNCPDRESTIRVHFGEELLDGRESCGAAAPLRGFFCETYAPADPGDAVEQPGG